jgi:predicted pyridoxine 5'-phosphate oxidase superfamily flavin-nucleotide-binding protein
MDRVASVAELEDVVGSRPLGSLLKSIDALDAHCLQLLALSPCAVLGFRETSGAARAAVLGGPPGFARIESPGRLRVPMPEHGVPEPGSPGALLFLVPGLGETLRINGRLHADGDLRIEIEEAFVHCAKALIRSAFWDGGAPAEGAVKQDVGTGALADPEIAAFLARAPFAVIASCDAAGAADASPKGDPAGFVALVGGTAVAVPDRPGNRRTDTFHNLLDRSAIALLVLVPGETTTLELSGRASLTRDPALLATMTVQGKTPKIAMVLDVERARLAACAALAAADLWSPARRADLSGLPRMATVWTDHVKLNKQRGLAATAMRKLVNASVLGAAIDRDYETNLY